MTTRSNSGRGAVAVIAVFVLIIALFVGFNVWDDEDESPSPEPTPTAGPHAGGEGVVKPVEGSGTPEPRGSTSGGLEDRRANLLKLHNDKRRAKCGSSSLSMTSGLNAAALYHADDMADENYFSHDSKNPYVPWYERIDRFISRDVGGENIAAGQTTAPEVFNDWVNSSGHYRNIMDCSFKYVGFGYAYNGTSDYDRYWVADFSY